MKCCRAGLVVLLIELMLVVGVSAAGPAKPIERAAAVRLFDSWKAAVPPRHLVGNVYYVGAIGVSSFLITTPAGHIVLDTGFADTLPIMVRGVAQLGFRVEDIKLVLSSHAHVDHVGGHAALQRLTGARIVASAEDARVLESGGAADFIPFPRDLIVYEPVKVDRIVADSEAVTLGGVTLTAHLTPGHTRGATTWTMDVADNGRVYRVVFFSSASINPGTRLTGPNAAYPEIASDLEKSFATFKAMRCDLFFAPHGGQFAMAEKFARLERGEKGAVVFADPEGWRTLIAAAEKTFRDQLAAEQSEK